MMRSFVVALCFGAVAAHFGAFPSPEKFKPLVAACENMDLLTNCSSTFSGVCKTDKDGSRWCNTCGDHHDHGHYHHMMHYDHGHHEFHHMMHKMKEMMGFHHEHHEWKKVGDCDANKQDGETCKVVSPGQCIPSGKCPMFKGEMVCRPNDAHPPKFVTEPCEGKKAGDSCSHMLVTGKCLKPKYMDDMYCKVEWPTKQEIGQATEKIGSVLTDLSAMLSDKNSENSEDSKLQTLIV